MTPASEHPERPEGPVEGRPAPDSSREGDGIRSPAQAVAPDAGGSADAEGAAAADAALRPAVIGSDGEAMPEDHAVATLLEHSIDVPVLAAAVEQQRPADAADTLEGLVEEGEEGDAGHLLVAMDDRKASEALSHMELPLAVGVLDDLIDEGRVDYAALLVELMAPDDAVDLLQAMDPAAREQCLAAMTRATAAGLHRLLGYDEETAAGLMTTRFLSLREQMTVGRATDAVREFDLPEEITHLPVLDREHRLAGVIGLRTLLVSRDALMVGDLMERHPRAIRADVDREDVAREFVRHDVHMMPVVDDLDRVLGIITVDDVIDAIREEQTEDVQRTVGAGKQEMVYSSVLEKFRGRFPWLAMSVAMMVPSAIVVRRFEGLIGELAVLAVLMPIVAAVTGNAGHQALAVTLRGIALAEVRPGRVAPLIRREALAGIFNGLAVGIVMAGGVAVLGLLWDFIDWRVGVVGGVATAGSIIAGTTAGSAIPLLMRRLGFDPAQSAAILLIMITDAIAFAAFLGLAYAMFPWLQAGAAAGLEGVAGGG
ncbi:MAG: magnesium transporter [Planctomycetota bacterium]|jgi:magnesium transporter